jgi:hypothetical protein
MKNTVPRQWVEWLQITCPWTPCRITWKSCRVHERSKTPERECVLGFFYSRFSIYFLEVKILIERESFIVIFLAGILHNSHSLKSEKVENCAVFVMDAEKKI